MTGPRFLRSQMKDRPNLVAFNEKQIILSIYSNADPHWTENGPYKVDILKIFRQKGVDWNSRLYILAICYMHQLFCYELVHEFYM